LKEYVLRKSNGLSFSLVRVTTFQIEQIPSISTDFSLTFRSNRHQQMATKITDSSHVLYAQPYSGCAVDLSITIFICMTSRLTNRSLVIGNRPTTTTGVVIHIERALYESHVLQYEPTIYCLKKQGYGYVTSDQVPTVVATSVPSVL